MAPVRAQLGGGHTGSPVTQRLLEAVKPKALVTVAVRAGGGPALTHPGAVQEMWLEEAPWVAVPSQPTEAAQEKESAEPSGSVAATSKVSTWPGVAVSEELEADVTTGFRWLGAAEGVMHRATVPVLCPPRLSERVTVRRQLLQEPKGTAEGVNPAELEEALLQEPAQEALQE
jgi:hypothetical protein